MHFNSPHHFNSHNCLRYKALFVSSLLVYSISFGQSNARDETEKKSAYGFSIQAYPAGFITTLHRDQYLKATTSLFLRAGWNLIDRKDFSDYNEQETGYGIGASAGLRKHFALKKGEIMAAFNTDVWNEWIHWANNTDVIPHTEGNTYTFVLQPWLEAGYFTEPSKSAFQIGLSGGFGREINVITDGDEVGHGWIGSVILHFQYQFEIIHH